MSVASLHQRAAAKVVADEKRMAIADLRRRVRAGEITLEELFCEPPAVLAEYTVADVLRFPRSVGRYRASSSLTELGRLAVRDQVNLLVALGDASARTRAWAAEHGSLRLRRHADAVREGTAAS